MLCHVLHTIHREKVKIYKVLADISRFVLSTRISINYCIKIIRSRCKNVGMLYQVATILSSISVKHVHG